jgi:hypothetical protein
LTQHLPTDCLFKHTIAESVLLRRQSIIALLTSIVSSALGLPELAKDLEHVSKPTAAI